ncbi:branched-chain amino acid transport system II carrier protein, partial [Intestinibacter sp.]
MKKLYIKNRGIKELSNLNEKSKMDFMVIGFAIFSMLFGAGNLIFPPF